MNIRHLFCALFYLRGVATWTFLLILSFAVLGSSLSSLASSPESSPAGTTPLISAPKNVLVLFSYHRAEWSDNVQKGIESVFSPYKNVNFFYEYMDTKRLKMKEYLDTLRKIYTEKYATAHIDVILCVDNNALDLLVENARTLLPDIPVVFCGINDYKPALHAARPDVTGVVEYGDFSDTLKIAFKARPNATKLYIVGDHTETGETNTLELLATLSLVAPDIQPVLTDRMSYEELSTTLQTAAPQQVAFFVSFWKDGASRNIEPWQLDAVFRKSAIPVFGRSEWMINRGMVGGKCVTGFAQGEAAARIALQILGGTPVSSLPVDTNSPNQYLFDHLMMKHYSIDEGIFPDDSISFNSPEPFYRVSKAFGVTVLVFSALLLTALVFLAVNIYRRRQALLALRKATASLEQSEAGYRGMIENIQDTFYRTDAQGVLLFVSPSGARLLGYDSPREMIGRPNASFWNNPEARLKMLEILKRDGAVRDFEVILVRKDGSPVPVSTTSSYYHDQDGQILGIEGIFRNITERKQAEADLLAERQYLTDIIDSLPDATLIIDTDNCLVVWNRAAEAMTGVQREELLGKGDYAYAVPFYGKPQPILIDLINISEKERERSYSSVRRLDDKIYAETFIQTLNDGEGAYLWGVAAPLYDRSGLRIGAVEVIKDISDLKKSEKTNIQLQEQLLQAQKIESIGRLAGGVAHDFNNMLGVILGHAELAQNQIDPGHPLFENLEEIRKAARRSADITRQLLAFARKQTIAPKLIDLNETVDGMLTMLRRLIGEDIHLAWLPGKNLGLVNMDPSQLDQILANLFVNARDAIADTGKVTIETDTVGIDEAYCKMHTDFVPGEYVMLAVSDNGCGMDAETMAHLFEPFFTTKEMGKGTGLGLAMIYGIVKQNSGFINVCSELGQGTTFKVYLPQHGGNAVPTPQEDTTGSVARGNETILLVEDEPMILDMTKAMLELHGYKVLPAPTPGEAIRLAQEHAGDLHLLMTDVVMPEMNGRNLAKNLLSLYPKLKCLFMSGYTANVIAHQGVLDEGVHFIQKPFSVNDLAAKTREALDE
jgi:PAS domain S-box-containing protein